MSRRGNGQVISAMVFALTMTGALALTGCSSSKKTKVEGLDKLGKIEVYTREKGSGTRSSFDDLIGVTSESADLKEAGSTEDMLKAVQSAGTVIGYLTAEAADDSVKVLTVDGKAMDDK